MDLEKQYRLAAASQLCGYSVLPSERRLRAERLDTERQEGLSLFRNRRSRVYWVNTVPPWKCHDTRRTPATA